MLSLVTLCLRFDEKIEEYSLRVRNLRIDVTEPSQGYFASYLAGLSYKRRAAEAAMKARELEDRGMRGQMTEAQEAYLHAIEYLKMAKLQYANDPSRRELVQK